MERMTPCSGSEHGVPCRRAVARSASRSLRARPLRRFGHVRFAGSDVADGWGGFIDGAIESGMTATRSLEAAAANHGGLVVA